MLRQPRLWTNARRHASPQARALSWSSLAQLVRAHSTNRAVSCKLKVALEKQVQTSMQKVVAHHCAKKHITTNMKRGRSSKTHLTVLWRIIGARMASGGARHAVRILVVVYVLRQTAQIEMAAPTTVVRAASRIHADQNRKLHALFRILQLPGRVFQFSSTGASPPTEKATQKQFGDL